jgi:hypothetical protein
MMIDNSFYVGDHCLASIVHNCILFNSNYEWFIAPEVSFGYWLLDFRKYSNLSKFIDNKKELFAKAAINGYHISRELFNLIKYSDIKFDNYYLQACKQSINYHDFYDLVLKHRDRIDSHKIPVLDGLWYK